MSANQLCALILLVVPLSASAFVVSNVPHSCIGIRSGSTLPLRPARVAKISLQMNLGERFIRLFKANANELLNRAEDPEKLLNQSNTLIFCICDSGVDHLI